MKYYFSFFLCLLFFISCDQKQESKIVLAKGISFELSKYRKQQITDVVYNLDFKIPKEKQQTISSKLELNFIVKDLKNDVFLDFNEETSRLKSLKINGKKSGINHQKEHIIIDKATLVLGSNSIEIFFDAGEKSLNRNDEFLYTLLVPDRASTLFPCFDQPDIKANYNLRITAPKDWKVLCGAFEESSIETDGFIETCICDFRFNEHLFIFLLLLVNLLKQPKIQEHLICAFCIRENNKEKIKESVDEVFKIHQNSIDFLEDYTQVNFPFKKMDFASIPPFQYGGMEHVGAIQYRESSLFLDKNTTQSRKLGRAQN